MCAFFFFFLHLSDIVPSQHIGWTHHSRNLHPLCYGEKLKTVHSVRERIGRGALAPRLILYLTEWTV